MQDRDGPSIVIVSEEMARRYWPGEDPIGKTFTWHGINVRNTIVGVAGDVRGLALDSEPRPLPYMPHLANANWKPMNLVVRTDTDSAVEIQAMREVVRRLDANVPVYNIRPLGEIVTGSLGPRRFTVFVLGCFAVLAVVLACVGLFGVVAYHVIQQTRDIGVRLALGAQRFQIFRFVIGRGLILTLVGIAIGLPAAFWLSQSLETLLYQVTPTDRITFLGVPVLLFVVAVIACYVPARRATKVDPMIALRHE